MNTLLLSLLCFGVSLTWVCGCDTSGCIQSGGSCTVLQSYLTCLNTASAGCTNTITKLSIDALISASQTSITSLGCGVAVSGSTACDYSTCVAGTTCTAMNTYLTCLNTATSSCTNSVTKLTIQGLVTAGQLTKTGLGCGVGAMTFSTATVFLCLMVSLFKTVF